MGGTLREGLGLWGGLGVVEVVGGLVRGLFSVALS